MDTRKTEKPFTPDVQGAALDFAAAGRDWVRNTEAREAWLAGIAAAKPHPVKWTDNTYAKLDPGIADMVRAFREAGIDTCQSCEGGRGHAFHRRTIEFWGDEADARRAIAVAANHGWPLRELAEVWDLTNPAAQSCWRITFNEPSLLDWLEADRMSAPLLALK